MRTHKRIGGWIVSGYAKWVTEMALLVDVDDHGDEWIPLSQIRDELEGCIAHFSNPPHPDKCDPMRVKLVINPWYVELKGLPHTKPSFPARPGSRNAASATIRAAQPGNPAAGEPPQ